MIRAKAAVSAFFLAAFVALASIGCSKSEYDWGTVSGSVTIDGKPVPKGQVTFNPTGATRGPIAGAEIENGQFRCEKIPPGQHSVSFIAHAAELDEFVDSGGMKRRVNRDILPPHYNEGVPAEVKPGENKLDFPLSSKGK